MIKPRFKILESATNAVTDREATYGSPAENYERQAALANIILKDKLRDHEGLAISAADMILINALAIKGSRLINQPNHVDSQVDLAGYASLLSEVA